MYWRCNHSHWWGKYQQYDALGSSEQNQGLRRQHDSHGSQVKPVATPIHFWSTGSCLWTAPASSISESPTPRPPRPVYCRQGETSVELDFLISSVLFTVLLTVWVTFSKIPAFSLGLTQLAKNLKKWDQLNIVRCHEMKCSSWKPLRSHSGCCCRHTALSSGHCTGDYHDRERQQHTRQSAACKWKYAKRGGLNVLHRLAHEEATLGAVTGVEFLFFSRGVLKGARRDQFWSDLVQPLWLPLSGGIKFPFSFWSPVMLTCSLMSH